VPIFVIHNTKGAKMATEATSDKKFSDKDFESRAGVWVSITNGGVDDKKNVVVYLQNAPGQGGVSDRAGDLKKGKSWGKNLGTKPCFGVGIAWTDAHGVVRLINAPNDSGTFGHNSVSIVWRTNPGGAEILDIRW
jgi:hypothetical protein